MQLSLGMFRYAYAHVVPEIKATQFDAGEHILWVDTGRYRLLHAKRKASQKVPAVLTLILRQVAAGFVKCDRAHTGVPASKQKRKPRICGCRQRSDGHTRKVGTVPPCAKSEDGVRCINSRCGCCAGSCSIVDLR